MREKIDLNGNDDASNWRDSKREGGTPGWRNSVSPPMLDVGFGHNSLVLPDLIFANEDITLTLQIYDFGINSSLDSMELIIFSDRNGDTLYQMEDLLIANRRIPTIAQKIDWFMI